MYFLYHLIRHLPSALCKIISRKVSGKVDFAIKNVGATWLREKLTGGSGTKSDKELKSRIKYSKYDVIALILRWLSIHLARVNFQLNLALWLGLKLVA